MGLRNLSGLFALLCLLMAPLAVRAESANGEPLLVLAYHDVRDDVAEHGDADAFATSTQNLIAHLDWLDGHGYRPVSLQQVVDASQGRAPLPPKAVLLTFDDGLQSLYTKVYPILRAYGYPAVAAVITGWMDLAPGQTVSFGPRTYASDDFVTWDQLREMQRSGLIEVATHTHALHAGIPSNPQGSRTPAAVTLRYDAETGYESEQDYRTRIHDDLERSSGLIRERLGKAPRAVVWPYGEHNAIAEGIASALGMPVSLDLGGRRAAIGSDLHGLARMLMSDNEDIADLVHDLRGPGEDTNLRAIQVDLDRVYDPDPQQQARNLDALIERINKIAPSHVFLQAFADPDGNGAADALYFPNRFLPMRADLFNFVSWQLRTRAGVSVYAWLPVLGFELPDAAQRQALALDGAQAHETFRLDFGKPDTARIVSGIYRDLAANAHIAGLLFHDDAFLRQGEAATSVPNEPAERTQALIDFTRRLAAAAGEWRPRLKTVRNLFARPVLEPESEAWFAQRLDAFNRAYDYTALMAMPWLEGAGGKPQSWLDGLVASAKAHDPELKQTIFQLQTVDWRAETPIPGEVLKRQSRRLQAQGVRHLAWYPDDFLGNQPALEDAREAMSARSFPYVQE